MSLFFPGGARTPAHRPLARRLGAVLVLAGLVLGLFSAIAGAHTEAADRGRIDVVQLEGVLDPRLVAHLEDVLRDAADGGADLVAVTLDSPGALRVDAADLARTVAQSPVPVLVWVGPPGARATGGAAVLAQAAHLLAVAPGTILGDARPLDLARSGAAGDDGLLGALAEERGRNVDIAARMASQGAKVVVVPDGEEQRVSAAMAADDALAAGLIVVGQSDAVRLGHVDVVAGSLFDVLFEVAGREVTVVVPGQAARTVALDVDLATASVRFDNPGLWRRMLHAVASPWLAYLLVVAGALCMLFELFQPGFGVAGVSGAVLFAFGIYGFAILPTSWLAFGLLMVGLALLAVDLAVAGLGPVTAAGTAAVGAGSWLLFAGSDHLGVPLWLIVLVTLIVVVFFVVIMTVVLRAQGNQALAGAEALIGRVGVVRSMLNPEGHVFVDGALWRARGPDDAGRVKTGTRVRVVSLDDDLTLEVALEDAETSVP